MLEDVAIITSKSPNLGLDLDGGSILIKQLVRYLPSYVKNVDVIFLRNKNECVIKDIGIRSVKVYEPKHNKGDKFEQRILNSKDTVEIIKKVHMNYKLIIVTHISNVFGIEELDEEIQRKIVLFPMFTSESYKKSGETVPNEYCLKEKRAFSVCKTIFTPSKLEKQQIVDVFGVCEEAITVIPRGFDLKTFNGRVKQLMHDKLDIIYIAAIRAQKNHLDLIELSKMLKGEKLNFCLHLVGGGEPLSKKIFFDKAKTENVTNNIKFHGILDQSKLSALMDNCDINISVARCETFGRGIYEGLVKGIPTIVYKRIECLWENLDDGKGIIGVDNCPEAMVNEILRLQSNRESYTAMSEEALNYRNKFNEENIVRTMILKMIEACENE